METALEQILTSFCKTKMISYLTAHPEDFKEAVKLAVSDKQPYSWRAAWLLWSFIGENDLRIQGHIKTIIDNISTKEDGHQRELLKILLKMKLNEEQEGYLYSLCVSVWEKINKKPSVRYTAFRFIIEIAKKHSDLSHEITYLAHDQYLDTLSPAVKKSILKMLREIDKN